MIGNMYLGIKKLLHQHVFCIHHYITEIRKDNGASFEICTKCKLIK